VWAVRTKGVSYGTTFDICRAKETHYFQAECSTINSVLLAACYNRDVPNKHNYSRDRNI
jgi:hypothetical protein